MKSLYSKKMFILMMIAFLVVFFSIKSFAYDQMTGQAVFSSEALDFMRPNAQDMEKLKLKKVEELQGYVLPEELAKRDGKYTMAAQMTYKEFLEMYPIEPVRININPERVIWVIEYKIEGNHGAWGTIVRNPCVLTTYDVESGEQLTMSITSDS